MNPTITLQEYLTLPTVRLRRTNETWRAKTYRTLKVAAPYVIQGYTYRQDLGIAIAGQVLYTAKTMRDCKRWIDVHVVLEDDAE